MPNSISIFADIGERHHVFDLLDEWAAAPQSVELPDLCGEHAYIRRQVGRVIAAVSKLETSHGVVPGKSWHAQLLQELDNKLAFSRTPPRLKANLPRIKELLSIAQEIADELYVDRLEPQAQKAEKFTGNRKGVTALYRVAEDIVREIGDLSKKSILPTKVVIQELARLTESRDHPVIQEVSETHIYWIDDSKKEQATSLGQFGTQMKEVRDRVRSSPK